MTRRLLCLALALILLPGLCGYAEPTEQERGADGVPYAADSLLVKLAAPMLELSVADDLDLAGPMAEQEYLQNSENFLYEYGSLEKLYTLKRGPGHGVSMFGTAGGTSWYVLKLEDGADVEEVRAALEKDPRVLAVNYDYAIQLPEDAADIIPLTVDGDGAAIGPSAIDTSGIQFYTYQKVYMESSGVPAAQTYLSGHGLNPGGSPDIVVAVLDTGVDYNHPELCDNIFRDEQGNVIGTDTTLAGSTDPAPDTAYKGYEHGTHCAGIVAAKGINVLGVAGNVKIMPVKVLSSTGANFSTLIAGIEFAVEHGADIITMSLGANVTPSNAAAFARDETSNALHELIRQHCGDVLFVAAAGNDSAPNETVGALTFNRSYPAAWPEVFAVMNSLQAPAGNGDWLNKLTDGGSNWDVNPGNAYEYDIMAPGTNIASTLPNNGYGLMSGTSMATPFVAGCLALLLTQYADGIDAGEFTKQDLLQILLDNGELRQGITYNAVTYSYPSVRVDRALEYRTGLTVNVPRYSYFHIGVSDHTQKGIEKATAIKESDGVQETKAVAFNYYYGYKRWDEELGDYIYEESTDIPDAPGSYTVRVSIDDLYYSGEATAYYNVFAVPGDFDGDGKLGAADISLYERHFGAIASGSGSPRPYDGLVDLDGNGKIDMFDVQLLISAVYRANAGAVGG